MITQSPPSMDDGERAGSEDRRLLLPLAEVAELLDVSLMTVRRLVRAGEMPYRLIRGAYRVPRAFVDDFASGDFHADRKSIAQFTATWAVRSEGSTEVAS